MELFLKLVADKTTTVCKNWIAMPVVAVDDGHSARGMMICELGADDRQYKKPFRYSDLTEDFLTHELVDLATGSEEKIIRITSRYGPLVSPYLYDAHERISEYAHGALMGKSYEEVTGQCNKMSKHLMSKALERFDTEIMQMMAYGNIGGSSDSAYSVKRITASLISRGIPIRGPIVSFDEIREVASTLLASVDTIEGMASKKPAVEIVRDLSSLECLEYIGTCLKNIGRAPGYIMTDEAGREIDMIELVSDGFLRSLPDSVIDGILLAYKGSFNGTLTEAIATMIKNIAESGRTWDYCAHCGRLFPLRPGQTRDRGGEYKLYCSPRCKNAGAQKRNREQKKQKAEQQPTPPKRGALS